MASVRGAALLTAALTLAGSLLGPVRDVVIAAVFGAGAVVDAFLVAQGLMNLGLGLVAGSLVLIGLTVVAVHLPALLLTAREPFRLLTSALRRS